MEVEEIKKNTNLPLTSFVAPCFFSLSLSFVRTYIYMYVYVMLSSSTWRGLLDSNTNNNAHDDDDDGDTKKYSKKRRERKKKGAHGEELYKCIIVDFEIFLSTRTVTQITEAIRSITELLHYYNYY